MLADVTHDWFDMHVNIKYCEGSDVLTLSMMSLVHIFLHSPNFQASDDHL